MPTKHFDVAVRAGAVHVVDTGGAGLPLVLLHGSGASAQCFYKQWGGAPAFDRRIIAMDLPGHGQSDDARDPKTNYTVGGFADTVQEVLTRLSVSRAAFVGWSLGGHVVIELMQRGNLVAAALLTGTPPLAPGMVGSLRAFTMSFDVLLASKEAYSEKDIDRFDTLCFDDQGHPSFRKAIARADGRFRPIFSKDLTRNQDQRATVLAADIPILFVNGSNDPFLRLSYLTGLKLRHPVAGGVVTIPGAGHAPFWTHPTAFNVLLGKFLNAVDAHEAAVAKPVRAAS